jgi:hypothetical protein
VFYAAFSRTSLVVRRHFGIVPSQNVISRAAPPSSCFHSYAVIYTPYPNARSRRSYKPDVSSNCAARRICGNHSIQCYPSRVDSLDLSNRRVHSTQTLKPPRASVNHNHFLSSPFNSDTVIGVRPSTSISLDRRRPKRHFEPHAESAAVSQSTTPCRDRRPIPITGWRDLPSSKIH